MQFESTCHGKDTQNVGEWRRAVSELRLTGSGQVAPPEQPAPRLRERRVQQWLNRGYPSSISSSHMSIVLPGEAIQTQHKTLKLGPGLQQIADSQGRTSIVVTRAGILEQNPKGNKFWVEGNSRRVSLWIAHPIILHYPYGLGKSMCPRHKSPSSAS